MATTSLSFPDVCSLKRADQTEESRNLSLFARLKRLDPHREYYVVKSDVHRYSESIDAKSLEKQLRDFCKGDDEFIDFIVWLITRNKYYLNGQIVEGYTDIANNTFSKVTNKFKHRANSLNRSVRKGKLNREQAAGIMSRIIHGYLYGNDYIIISKIDLLVIFIEIGTNYRDFVFS